MVPFVQQMVVEHPVCVGHTLDAGSAAWVPAQPFPAAGSQGMQPAECDTSGQGTGYGEQEGDTGHGEQEETQEVLRWAVLGAGLTGPRSRLAAALSALSLPFPHRACASSETESEAGDIMDQQFEEMNNRLNSVTDPTGFLRMVRRNNLFNRYVWPCLLGWCQAGRPAAWIACFRGMLLLAAWASGWDVSLQERAWYSRAPAPRGLGVTAAPPGEGRKR